jgi:hypothetical protein
MLTDDERNILNNMMNDDKGSGYRGMDHVFGERFFTSFDGYIYPLFITCIFNL